MKNRIKLVVVSKSSSNLEKFIIPVKNFKKNAINFN